MRKYAFILSSTLFRHIAACVLLLSLVCPTQAIAETENELTIGAGGRVIVLPYKRYDTIWTPIPILNYEGKYAYVREYAVGAKLVNLKFLEISAFVEYDYTGFRSKKSSDRQLRELSNRHYSANAGIGARLITPYGMFHASGAQNILGHSKGLTGLVGYMTSLEYKALEFIPSIGMQWSSNRYNDYYYGISDNESLKSGLDSYRAGGGASPYAGGVICYSLTDSWEIYSSGELVFLSSAIKNSPMVSRTNTYNLMLGLAYSF